jgi:hypothetical protein
MTNEVSEYPISLAVARWISENYGFGEIVPRMLLWEKLELPEPGMEAQLKMSFKKMENLKLKRCEEVYNTRRRLLVDYSIYLQVKAGVGYLLVEPHEQADVVSDKMDKKFIKHMNDAILGLNHIRVELLNMKQQQSHEISRQRVSALRSMMKRERREFKITPRILPEPPNKIEVDD